MHDQGNARTNVLQESGPKCDGLAFTPGKGLLAERTKDNAGLLDLARNRPELKMVCSSTGRGPRVRAAPQRPRPFSRWSLSSWQQIRPSAS